MRLDNFMCTFPFFYLPCLSETFSGFQLLHCDLCLVQFGQDNEEIKLELNLVNI